MVEDILNREDQRRYSLSQHELERRWKAVRERMSHLTFALIAGNVVLNRSYAEFVHGL